MNDEWLTPGHVPRGSAMRIHRSSYSIQHLRLIIACASAASARAQWSFENVDAYPDSRAPAWIGLAGDGTPVMMYSGPTDGFSCDGTADVYVKVRVAPNNWIEPTAATSPSRLRVTRPHMAVNAAGDLFIVFELRWAYYTGIVKFRRTGPTTWVRDADPVLIMAPTPVSCGANDPNLPSTAYLYGYNPKVAVAPNGSLHVFANRVINGQSSCVYAYNSGGDWRSGWTINLALPGGGSSLVADDNSDVHVAILTANDDPNLVNNVYVKLRNGTPVVGPIELQDGDSRTSDSWIAIGNATAYLTSMQWNYGGSNTWNAYAWNIVGTQVTGPTNVSNQSGGSGTTFPRVVARKSWVRYYLRCDAQDARWAWYLIRLGFPNERITQAGHDTGGISMDMDTNGNIHAALQDWSDGRAQYVYGYRANEEPPPGPQGTIAGTATDQFGVPVSNVTINAQNAALTATGPGGTYTLNINAGTYTVTAGKTHYTGATAPDVSVQVNQTTSLNFVITGQPPAPVAFLQATPRDHRISLQWQNPASNNFSGTTVWYRTDRFPTAPSDGTLVVDQPGSPGSTAGFNHAGLQGGQTCYYTAFACFADASRFWAGGVSAAASPLVPADFDGDGDVDLSDFSAFQVCFNGPNKPAAFPASCGAKDLDGDVDVDLDDFARFQVCFNGPNRLPGCP